MRRWASHFFPLSHVSLYRERSPGPPETSPPPAWWSRGLLDSPPQPISLSPVFKRKKRLLLKSLSLFAVSPATGRFDNHNPAPASRTTYRNFLGRGGGGRGIVWGCDWHPELRLGWRSASGLHEARSLSVAGGLQPGAGTTPGETRVCILEIAGRVR